MGIEALLERMVRNYLDNPADGPEHLLYAIGMAAEIAYAAYDTPKKYDLLTDKPWLPPHLQTLQAAGRSPLVLLLNLLCRYTLRA